MAQVSNVLARLKRDPIADLPIAARVEQLCREQNIIWRDRLPPLALFRVFLIQILNGNVAIVAPRQLTGIDFAPSSHGDARKRLPLQLLISLSQWLHGQAEQYVDTVMTIGQRILIVDGSTYSMEDTPELHARFNLPAGTKNGVGYPSGKLMGLLDAATGMFVEKELAVYLTVYNLVRLAMPKAAKDQGVSPWRISFVDALRWLAARMAGLKGVARLIVNPDRGGRSQLRVIRRRLKEYDLLTKPPSREGGRISRKTSGK